MIYTRGMMVGLPNNSYRINQLGIVDSVRNNGMICVKVVDCFGKRFELTRYYPNKLTPLNTDIDKANHINKLKKFLRISKGMSNYARTKKEYKETFRYYESFCLRDTKKWVQITLIYATTCIILLYLTSKYLRI